MLGLLRLLLFSVSYVGLPECQQQIQMVKRYNKKRGDTGWNNDTNYDNI